jgi:putative membrane protein
MKKLISQVLAACLGLWLATIVIPTVSVTVLPNSNFFGISLIAVWQIFLLLGIIVGLLNYFVKPVINIITLPLRILTLGLFGFVVNMAIIWVADAMFKELTVPLFLPLIETTLLVWILNFVFQKILVKKEV